jgi:hypothetical protein
MAVIYLKLASLAEIGLPERYALVYYTLIAIVAELIGQKLIPHQAGVRKGEMGARKPRDNLGGQFLPERIHLVPQRIRLKKRDVVDRIMSVPRPKEALRNLIDSSDHLKRRSKKDLYALLSADPVTRDTAFQIVNEVGLAHAKLFAPTAPHR